MDLRTLFKPRTVYWFKDEPSPPQVPATPSAKEQIVAQANATPSVYGPGGTRVYSGDPTVAGSFKVTETLSPEQQKLYEGRNQIAQALLGRSGTALGGLPVGYKFDGATNPTTNAVFENQRKLLDRSFDRDQTRLGDQLANQGIPMGSEAYNTEIENFRRSKDDAMERAAAEAIQQGFSQDISTRQQNLNEVAQALGGSQLTPVGQGGGIDTSGAFGNEQAAANRAYQAQLAQYNAGVAGNNSMMGGLFSLGAAAIPKLAFSDRRLKRDVTALGEVMPGVGWYAFRYVWDSKESPLRTGVMADEVERLYPFAVIEDASGFLMVDYGALFAGRTVH